MVRWLFASSLLMVCCTSGAVAQTGNASVTFIQFQEQVAANHPVARQARLVGAQGRSAVTEAWGAFEPKLSLSLAQKTFRGQSYYSYLDAAIKIPTPIGTDLKLGFERAAGDRLSPDRYTPANGLLTLGLSVPLGQGLLTDERRTALAQARASRDIADAEQQSMTNKLLLDAAKTFGNWYVARRRAEIADDGVRLATFRFDAVVQRLRNGDSPAIDTLEASLEVQRRLVTRAEAENDLRTATLIVSGYLWDERGRAVDLAADARPVLDGLADTATDTSRLASWLNAVSARHPDLRKAQGKLRAAEADRRLALQRLVPYAEASLSSIAARDRLGALTSQEQWSDNFKAAVDAQSPVLFLKERGKSAQSQQKVEFARWDRDATERELAYELRIALNDLVLLEKLLTVQRAMIRGVALLRDAEQTRYENGESTLLLVNLRERTVLDETTKLAALEGKIATARAALAVAAGDPALINR